MSTEKSEKIFIDGDFNESYESRVRNADPKNPVRRVNELLDRIKSLKAELEKLQAFKQYVHDRLDKMGIPPDPEPENNATHGCRIEGRLNVVEKKIHSFSHGYACACANMIRDHHEDSMVEDCFSANFMTIDEMRRIGVDESDIEVLKPIVSEIERKRRII